ncbi:hypothetical protein GC175_04800 [bacterium]|nr:hypothetical protein [bacterium]
MNNSFQPDLSTLIQGRIEKLKLTSMIMEMERRLQIYLPPSYDEQPNRCYPVLYVHYGQRIFEPQHPGDEAWYLHRLLEELFATDRIEEIIVVGIVAERVTFHRDYSHYVPAFQSSIPGGVAFEKFIVHELKPFVDSNYRTLSDPAHTAMVGASNSAVFTYNIAHRHPNIFGKIGLLSPLTYSFHDKQWLYPTPIPKYNGTLWICMGEGEGEFTLQVRDLIDALLAQGFIPGVDLFYTLMPNAGHHDTAWGAQMLHSLLLFFGRAGATPIEKIGRPTAVELLGDDKIGVGSHSLVINPLVYHDTGFYMTALSGKYRVTHPKVLSFQPYNHLYGLAQGESDLIFTIDGLTATRRYFVIPNLRDVVHLHLRAYTPLETPDVEQIWFEMYPLMRTRKCCYEGHLTFPRGFAIEGKFSWGMRKFEQQADGSPVPNRRLRATEDATIDYTIERWGGLDI